ncbi:MAG: hypothetical protein ACSLFM_14555, partial [Tepidiformaceae bacterium]
RAPAYYWAGEGSARVHRLKGFTYGIDEDAYSEAYSVERLRWLRDSAGADFVFLSYNWGLPPELESPDWDAFEEAAQAAHDLGMGVAAYVQPSNAVALGSYADRDWYAATPKGRRVPYYAGRYFTCLNSPEWRETVFARVADALIRGADAIFLDNCAFGGMPVPLSTDYTAFAGCFCSRCQASFRAWQTARGAHPAGIPRLFRPGRDPVAREFSHWRAWCLTGFLREIRDRMRRQSPGAALLTNTVGAVNLNTYNIFGVDLPELAHIVDWMFVENLQSPRAGDGLLVQNAGTFKLLRALKPGAPALSISYDRGIGVDAVPAPAVFERTMAEAYAAGGIPVLRAGEYIEDRDWTLLQPGRHDAHAAAARDIVRFSVESSSPDRVSAAGVAVFVPPGLAWRGDLYPAQGSDFQSVIQALVGSAIPFTVVVSEADLGPDVRVLLVPAGVPAPASFAGVVVRYDELGIRKRRRSLIDYGSRPLEPLLRRVGPWAVDGYFSRVHVRRFADRLNLVFRLVFREQFTPLELTARSAAKLRAANPCAVFAPTPVFADLWRTSTTLQLHLVNY